MSLWHPLCLLSMYFDFSFQTSYYIMIPLLSAIYSCLDSSKYLHNVLLYLIETKSLSLAGYFFPTAPWFFTLF